MSEGNSIWDGPGLGDESEADSWQDHSEAAQRGSKDPQSCEHIERDEQGYCLECGAYRP